MENQESDITRQNIEEEKSSQSNFSVSQAQINSIKTTLAKTLTSYVKKRRRNKVGAISVHIFTILFTAGTTILIGWNPKYENLSILNIALILSTLATGISTLGAVFDYRALWVSYNISISRIKFLIAKIYYLESVGVQNLKQPDVEELFSRYEIICCEMEKDYKEIRKSDDA